VLNNYINKINMMQSYPVAKVYYWYFY